MHFNPHSYQQVSFTTFKVQLPLIDIDIQNNTQFTTYIYQFQTNSCHHILNVNSLLFWSFQLTLGWPGSMGYPRNLWPPLWSLSGKCYLSIAQTLNKIYPTLQNENECLVYRYINYHTRDNSVWNMDMNYQLLKALRSLWFCCFTFRLIVLNSVFYKVQSARTFIRSQRADDCCRYVVNLFVIFLSGWYSIIFLMTFDFRKMSGL